MGLHEGNHLQGEATLGAATCSSLKGMPGERLRIGEEVRKEWNNYLSFVSVIVLATLGQFDKSVETETSTFLFSLLLSTLLKIFPKAASPTLFFFLLF